LSIYQVINALGSDLIATPLLDGRFLRAGDTDAVVLNQNARVFFPEVNVGDEVVVILALMAIMHIIVNNLDGLEVIKQLHGG
jgi:hypothetical protein